MPFFFAIYWFGLLACESVYEYVHVAHAFVSLIGCRVGGR